MGDRVAVMRKGKLQQVAPPQELYDRPVNLFVGGFIGSPAMNMVEARLERSDGQLLAVVGDQRLGLGGRRWPPDPASRSTKGGTSSSGSGRRISRTPRAPDAPADQRLGSEVVLREALGSRLMVHFQVSARPLSRTTCASWPRTSARWRREDLDALAGTEETVMVGRFGALDGRRTSASRRPSTRARCTSSISRPASGSTLNWRGMSFEPRRKELEWLRWLSWPLLVSRARARGARAVATTRCRTRRARPAERTRRGRSRRYRSGRDRSRRYRGCRGPAAPAERVGRDLDHGHLAGRRGGHFEAVLDGFRAVPERRGHLRPGRRRPTPF